MDGDNRCPLVPAREGSTPQGGPSGELTTGIGVKQGPPGGSQQQSQQQERQGQPSWAASGGVLMGGSGRTQGHEARLAAWDGRRLLVPGRLRGGRAPSTLTPSHAHLKSVSPGRSLHWETGRAAEGARRHRSCLLSPALCSTNMPHGSLTANIPILQRGQTEAQKKEVTRPRSPSWAEAESGFKPHISSLCPSRRRRCKILFVLYVQNY